MSTYPLSKTENSSDLVHYFREGPQIHILKINKNGIKNVMFGRANARAETSLRAPLLH